MTKEQINNNYDENSIEVLEGLEAVRKRPGMYIGSTGTKGLHHCIWEIVDNSVDESMVGICNTIKVSINKDNSITVKDNGRGIPCGIHPKMGKSTLEVVVSTLHAGGKFGGSGYKTSGGLHGVGSSVVNALSIDFEATVHRDNQIYYQRYSKGKKQCEVEIIGKSDKTGTIIRFKPDNTIFNTTEFNYDVISKRFKDTAFLNKNITIILEDKRCEKGKTETFKYEGGLLEFVQYLNSKKDIIQSDICYLDKQIEDYKVEIAFQYTDGYNENLYSYANNINTPEGGYHVNGFYEGLTKALNDYARANNILKDKEENFQKEDIKEGLTSVISIKIPNPEFEGQTKSKLGNTDVKSIISLAIKEYMQIFLIENKKSALQIFDKILLNKKSRESAEKARLAEKKKDKSQIRKIVGKLTDCISKNPEECEIFLVEGDSAGGNAKIARNRKFQAILPQRGKSANVLKKKIDLEKCQDLKNIKDGLGVKYGKSCNPKDCRYHHIILMADGDSDGYGHIVPLWLTYFYKDLKPLIDAGFLYIAMPPLYKNVFKQDKKEIIKYTYSEDEQIDFLNNNNSISIQRYKGLGEMSAEQLWETTMNPETRKLIKVIINDEDDATSTFNLLMSDKVPPRHDFIINNAKFAKNIDI